MAEYGVGKSYEMPVLITEAALKLTKTGSTYLAGKMRDMNGVTLVMRKWGVDPSKINLDDLVEQIVIVGFSVESYNNELQANVQKMWIAPEGKYNLSDFMQKYITKDDAVSYIKATIDLIKKIKDDEIRDFVKYIFKDLGLFDEKEKAINSRFVTATAAKANHHVGYGGLLVHSYNVALKAYYASKAYKSDYCNSDYCIAGGLLHDIGKLESYSTTGAAINLTIPGVTLGHTIIGVKYLERYRDKIFEGKLILLQHIIATHHGRVEFGAIDEPMTVEALLVSQADMGDMYEAVLKENRDLPEISGNIRIGNDRYVLPIKKQNVLMGIS